MEDNVQHPCSCPLEKQNIVLRNVFNDPEFPPSEHSICTTCNTSNCAFYIGEHTIGHYHKWDVFVGTYTHPALGVMVILRCNVAGCHHKVYVVSNNDDKGKKHYMDEPGKCSPCKRIH